MRFAQDEDSRFSNLLVDIAIVKGCGLNLLGIGSLLSHDSDNHRRTEFQKLFTYRDTQYGRSPLSVFGHLPRQP